MAIKEATLIERVQTSYKQLTSAATNLNIASDELGKAISVLETALQKLNLGLSAWTKITGGDDDDSGMWWRRDIGYTQVGTEWVISVRSRSGDYGDPRCDSESVWRFNEAPRWMQVEAFAKIPDLIERLTEQADETRKKLKTRAEQAFQLAAVIEEVSKKEQDWQGKLQSAMVECGLQFSADAIGQPDTEVALVKNELKIKASKGYQLDLGSEEIKTALKHLGHPDLPFKVIFMKSPKKASEGHQ
jgi:uncharacterized protein YukE